MAWSKSLAGFARQVEQDISARQREMVLFALQQLIQHSPVDTGAYRGSHFVTIDSTDDTSVPEPDKSGDRVRREAEQIILAAEGKPFKAVTIQSNIVYGAFLEQGGSQQAPGGVYSIAFNNLRERYGG